METRTLKSIYGWVYGLSVAFIQGGAQALRNKDGNLIRPNAFVLAQKAGTAYDITELAQ